MEIEQLESSLKRFGKIVGKLRENPCLDNASDVNIASIKLGGLFHSIFSEDKEIPEDYADDYIMLIHSCYSEFNKMLPSLNGDALHIDLYREQMSGREDIVRMLMKGLTSSEYS